MCDYAVFINLFVDHVVLFAGNSRENNDVLLSSYKNKINVFIEYISRDTIRRAALDKILPIIIQNKNDIFNLQMLLSHVTRSGFEYIFSIWTQDTEMINLDEARIFIQNACDMPCVDIDILHILLELADNIFGQEDLASDL